MRIGSRIVRPEEAGRWDIEIVQISVYSGFPYSIELMRESVSECRLRGLRYVLHPVNFSLLDPAAMENLRVMAELAGDALILHDERSSDGGRLTGNEGDSFNRSLEDLRSVVHVSFENATDTPDINWFWSNYADSITLDIGHIEAAGIDSVGFMKGMDVHTLSRVEYVHMHRNAEFRRGLTDHWYLIPGCRELHALRELLLRKDDVDVILEINETDMIEGSLMLLRELREEVCER